MDDSNKSSSSSSSSSSNSTQNHALYENVRNAVVKSEENPLPADQFELYRTLVYLCRHLELPKSSSFDLLIRFFKFALSIRVPSLIMKEIEGQIIRKIKSPSELCRAYCLEKTSYYFSAQISELAKKNPLPMLAFFKKERNVPRRTFLIQHLFASNCLRPIIKAIDLTEDYPQRTKPKPKKKQAEDTSSDEQLARMLQQQLDSIFDK